MDDPIMARLLDAALPFVAGRKLETRGFVGDLDGTFDAWKDDDATESCLVVIAQSTERIQRAMEDAAGTVVLLLPGLTRPPELPGAEIIDVQYAFEDIDGVADPRAGNTLASDADWPMAEGAGSVWLDTERPERPLACIVVAKVGG